MALPVVLPPPVVRLVREEPHVDLLLEIPQVAPGLVVLEPGVHQRLVHAVALPHLHLQQVRDQIDGLRRDLLPRMRGVHEGGVLDLFVDVLVFVEGKGSGEGDVDDDAAGPHVQGSVVSLVSEDLGGEIGGRAYHRLPESFFSDNSSEAEITELHLRKESRKTGGRFRASDRNGRCSWSEDA